MTIRECSGAITPLYACLSNYTGALADVQRGSTWPRVWVLREKTIIKTQQTVVIAAVGCALWMSGSESGWLLSGFQTALNQRTVAPGGLCSTPTPTPTSLPPSSPGTQWERAKILITVGSGNQYQSGPKVSDIPEREWPLLSNKEIDTLMPAMLSPSSTVPWPSQSCVPHQTKGKLPNWMKPVRNKNHRSSKNKHWNSVHSYLNLYLYFRLNVTWILN